MKGKFIIVHLIAAAITGPIALILVPWALRFADAHENSAIHEFVFWGSWFVIAFLFYLSIFAAHVFVNYLWFAFLSSEYEICGLYTEAYFNESGRPSLSLMVVYFDLFKEAMKIVGYSYCQDDDDANKFSPVASWQSCALHHTEGHNNFEIFYIHEGDIGTTHRKVRGTTICRLPTSPLLSEYGNFCDLEDLTGTNLKPQFFEIVRARESEEKYFIDSMKVNSRAGHYSKLAAPKAKYFWQLVQAKGPALLEQYTRAHRHRTMRRVHEAFLSASHNPRAGDRAGPPAVPAPQGMAALDAAPDKWILARLQDFLRNSYAPYSNFRVAAAVVDENNQVHFGVNVENQSFPVATCAEGGAISAMHVAGGHHIKKLFLLSEPNIQAVPCGACRQRLSEFADADTVIYTFQADGSLVGFPLEELFPHGFRFK